MQTKLFAITFIIFILIGITGCSLGNDPIPAASPTPVTLGHDIPLQGEGVLHCSDLCSDLSQCGESVTLGDRDVVLLHAENPSLQNHDMVFESGIPVQILELRNREIARAGQEDTPAMSINFYKIKETFTDRDGWVAGWCIRQP